jgi:D-alanine transfer protein
MGDVFKYHILPLISAFLIAFLIWNYTAVSGYIGDVARLRYLNKQAVHDDFYPNLIDYPAAYERMQAVLPDTNGLLILGSSELTGDDSSGFIPYRWLNKYSPYNVLAIGHAGNQAFSMLTQLASLDRYIDSSRIVIILSPIWYLGTNAAGTSSELFLQYSDREILRNILSNEQLDTAVRTHILRYVRLQYSHIVSPSPELKQMRYEGIGFAATAENLVYAPLKVYNQWVIQADQYWRGPVDDANGRKSLGTARYSLKSPMPDVDSLMQLALLQHKAVSSGNNWGIEDTYYREHINGSHGLIKTLPNRYNVELRDLEVLAAYLERKQVNALFIMQGVNPFYYNHLNDFKPVDNQINEILRQHHLSYYNMLEYDTTRYVKGMLKDIMHYGAYGWLTLNREILHHYENHEKAR